MDKIFEIHEVDKREEYQFAIALLTNPAFQSDDSKKENFFCMVDYKLDTN